MKIQEANKIIAEYMGHVDIKANETDIWVEEYDDVLGYYDKHFIYHKSLDTLISVWEKLGVQEIKLLDANYEAVGWFADLDDRVDRRMYSKDPSRTITESACIATAKAIKELK